MFEINYQEFKHKRSHSFFQLLNRPNVAILLKLSLKCNENIKFIVANTHLLYNPKRNNVRLAQSQLLLAEIEKFSRKSNSPESNKSEYLPTLLMGDFNFTNHSNPYNFIRTGILENPVYILPPESGVTPNCIVDRKACTEIMQGNHQQKLTHPLQLESVYPIDRFERATTRHHKWVIVDHMFYTREPMTNTKSKTNLTLLARLLPPLVFECQNIGPIPNQSHGSDHYYIAGNFLLGEVLS